MKTKGGSLVVLLLLASASIMAVVWTWTQKPSRTSSRSPADRTTQPALSNTNAWNRYRNDEFGFAIEYPPEYQIQVRSSNGAPYSKDFLFTVGGSVPLRLGIIDLTRYLPTTNTPTIPEYLKTLRSFDKFKQADVAGKVAYEYLTCGSAACTQKVVFIRKDTLYDFSIDRQGINPDDISFDKSPPATRAIIESLKFHNRE